MKTNLIENFKRVAAKVEHDYAYAYQGCLTNHVATAYTDRKFINLLNKLGEIECIRLVPNNQSPFTYLIFDNCIIKDGKEREYVEF